jgi:N-acetylmuramoyl-L-alanine amidase
MLKSLSEIANLHFRKVEQAAFVVLKSPDIPSLLVEVGFITYGPEERKLRNVRYQEEIATRLALGIESYFIRRPPPGTYLANVKSQKYAMLKENLPE